MSSPASQTPDHGDEIGAVARGAGIALFGRVAGNALRYGSYLIIARLLGAQAFGLYMLGVAVYQFTEIASGLGLPQGVVQRVALHRTRHEFSELKGVLRDALRLPLLVGAAIGALLFLTAPQLAQGLFAEPGLTPVLRLFALGTPFGAAGLVVAMATTGFQTTRYLVYGRELVQPSLLIAGVAVAGLLRLGAPGAAGAWTLAAALTLLLSLLFLRALFPGLRDRALEPRLQGGALVRFSLPLWAAALAGFALLWTDTLMLGYFRTASEVGIYRAAAQTALLLMIFLHALNTIFSPTIATLYQRGEREKLAHLFKTTARWSLSLTLPGFLLMVLAGEELLGLFGGGFVEGALPLTILAAAQLANAATGSVGFTLIMTGKTYHHLAGELALAGTNVLLNLLLIPLWGLTGAALATGASVAGVNLLRLAQVYRLHRLHPFGVAHLKSLVAAGLAGLGAWLLLGILPELHFLFTLGIAALAIAGLYLFILALLGFEPEDRSVSQILSQGLRKGRREHAP